MLLEILSNINEEEVPSNYSSFYSVNLKMETLEKKNIKINNKIIHQSKLLKYFEEKYENKKVQDDLNKLLKSINYLQKTKDSLLSADRNYRIANNKAQDISIKKLTKDNPTMKKKFDES